MAPLRAPSRRNQNVTPSCGSCQVWATCNREADALKGPFVEFPVSGLRSNREGPAWPDAYKQMANRYAGPHPD